MPIAAQCDACGYRLRVPGKYAGRRVTCTKCGAAVPVGSRATAPPAPVEKKAPPRAAPASSALREPQSMSDRLGMTAMMLGLVSILVLCLPFIGYAAIAFSALGVVIGMAGLLDALVKGLRQRFLTAGSSAAFSLSMTGLAYPCLGTITCLISLVLALIPHMHIHH
jgi:hypothetical protein